MTDSTLYDHLGWQWCTPEGAELHTLLMGLESSFPEKLAWLEEAENLTLAMAAGRARLAPIEPTADTMHLISI